MASALAQATPAFGSAPPEVQALLDEHAGKGNVPGILLYVGAPEAGIDWLAASGVTDFESGTPLGVDATFRIAGNTKTYTAAAILRLAENGRLDPEATIATLLPDEFLAALSDEGYRPDAITIDMLARHASGLRDFAGTESYVEAVVADPRHRWTRLEQVQFAMNDGEPLGPPGEQFAYSDTGYILLGQILEDVTGLSLAEAYRSLLRFDDLGLDATWLESQEPVPVGAGPMTHAYLGPTDSFDFDPSFDLYGGGGLVASIRDLADFYQALFAHEVFDQPETLDQMLAPLPDPAFSGVGMGIFGSEFEGGIAWGLAGYWGSIANVVPHLGLTFALMVNQAAPGEDAKLGDFTEELLGLVLAEIGQGGGMGTGSELADNASRAIRRR
jgi:D-alanyl-D-alanine carboxypeptidase